MKGKYITTYVLLACLSHRKRNNVHADLVERITERKQLLLQWRKLLLTWLVAEGDIYAQLDATIAERNRVLARLNQTVHPGIVQIIMLDNREAA